MARPKIGEPIKQKLTLTVSAEVREYLDIISKEKQQSISEILSNFAKKEYKKIERKNKKII